MPPIIPPLELPTATLHVEVRAGECMYDTGQKMQGVEHERGHLEHSPHNEPEFTDRQPAPPFQNNIFAMEQLHDRNGSGFIAATAGEPYNNTLLTLLAPPTV